MNHEALGISTDDLRRTEAEMIWETSNLESDAGETPALPGNIEVGTAREDARLTIQLTDHDCVRARQAREDFIRATIIFFGLDGECPSHSGKVTPC
jgi:hypothetical protein